MAGDDVPPRQPGPRDRDGLSDGGAGGRLPPPALGAAGLGGVRAAHRLRQHRQPAARPGGRALPGDGDPRGDRSGPRPSPPRGSHGEHGARGGRRAARAPGRVLGCRDADRVRPRGRSASGARPGGGAGARLRARAHRAERTGVRPGARLPHRRTAAARGTQGGRTQRIARRQPGPAPQRAGRERDRTGAGTPHRRRAPDPERDRAQRRSIPASIRVASSRGGSPFRRWLTRRPGR